MFDFLFHSPAWQLIALADIMTKLVLLTLLALSVICVWIALTKYLRFSREKIAMKRLQLEMKQIRSFDELLALGKKYHHTAGGAFLIKGLGELKDLLAEKKQLSIHDLEYLLRGKRRRTGSGWFSIHGQWRPASRAKPGRSNAGHRAG